jgi:predicted GH43/DUF377 family glycosyl hydrolase
MLGSTLWAALVPVGAVVVEEVEDGALPLEWTLMGGEEASFNVPLPEDGTVVTGNLTLEGSGRDILEPLDHGISEWSTSPFAEVDGFDTSGDVLDVVAEHRGVWLGPNEMASYEEAIGLEVGEVVTLAPTSPDFTGSGGEIWKYYIEVELAMDNTVWVYDVLTYIPLEIPAGHLFDTNEIRVADWRGDEVPCQIVESIFDPTGGSIVFIELLFPADLPPDDSRAYRVYYGNRAATDPKYEPYLLNVELWNYTGITDPRFTGSWTNLRWSGGIAAGRPYARIADMGWGAKAFEQAVEVNPGRTYSQVWTNDDLKFGDFQLHTSIDRINLMGPDGSRGFWGLDFRVSGNDCYRLVYEENIRPLLPSRIALFRVANERHLVNFGTPNNDWTLLEEKYVSIALSRSVDVLIKAVGNNLEVYADDMTKPILEVKDGNLDTGLLGTFVGAGGVLFSGNVTTASCVIGPMFIWSHNINLTQEGPSYFPSEERNQYFRQGTYLSETLELDGARDTLFTIDVDLPWGTAYTADILASDGTTLVSDIRDAQGIPESLLDGGFKLEVELTATHDYVRPALKGWGVGYRAVVNPTSGRTPQLAEGVIHAGEGLRLPPVRDIWLKEEKPVLRPDNIDEDRLGITVGSLEEYGNGVRIYYTGTSVSGLKTICMAQMTETMEVFGHRAIFKSSTGNLAWDAVKSDPWVFRLGDTWLMYYTGTNRYGQIGLAISSNGIHWSTFPTPVLSPGTGGFDGYSIEDCSVIYDDSTHRFHMYYTGRGSSSSLRTSIGYATSGDGVNWVRSSGNPVLTPGGSGSDWDSAYIRDPYPVFTRDQVILYYIGGKGAQPSSDLSSVGYAFSVDGINFKKAMGNPVLEPRKGGMSDDYQGIRGMLVVEDDMDRHVMLFSGEGADFVERGFIAQSGYGKEGYYITKPFVLDRAPRMLGPLDVDADIPDGTALSVWVRSLTEGLVTMDWTELKVGEVLEGLPVGNEVELRFNLTSEFGDETPYLRHSVLDYISNVRHSTLSMFPVIEMPEPIVTVDAEFTGGDLDMVSIDVTNDGTEWIDIPTYNSFEGQDRGAELGYQLTVAAEPGRAPIIEGLHLDLTYISFLTEIAVDVGDDGEADWTHEGRLTGETTVDLSEAFLVAHGLANRIEDGTVFVPVVVTTSTPGILRLVRVIIEVDTPPVITEATPEGEEVWLDEGTSMAFEVVTDERDGQALDYQWYVDDTPQEGAEGPSWSFEPSEEPLWEDPVTVRVEVTDGTFQDGWAWTVHVTDTTIVPNVAPVIESSDPSTGTMTIDENQTATFSITASDPDTGPSPLSYRWYIGDELQPSETGASFSIVTDYGWAGEYTIRAEAFDGELEVNHTWEFIVNNVKPPGPPNGNGGDGDEPDGANMLPLLIIIIIVAVAAGAVYTMRARKGPSPETSTDDLGDVPEPITADVPLEPETPPPQTPMEGSLAKEVAAGPSEGATGLDLAKAAGAAAPIVAVPLADMEKDRTFVVEEVYVVYNDGRLMYHKARAERTSVDTDLFGGMFTAIQQFIHDSMGGGEGGAQVGRLDYGENRILVERGNHVFLAAIIYGEEQEALREALRDVINRIEGAYAGVIERWSGDQTQLAGVADFVAPLIGLTQDLTRETIMSRTRKEGVKMISEVEFFQGFVRLKVAVRNDTKTVTTNVATDIAFDSSVLRVDRIQPEYPMSGTKVTLGTIGPREKKTVAYYLDPLICQESDIDGTTSYKDHEGNFHTVTMKRRRADIVCPIFFTEENANTAMLKRLIKEELNESDSKLFTIPKMLEAPDAFQLAKEVIRGHDVRFVREFLEDKEEGAFRGEAWFFGITKVKKDKMVIRASVWEDRKTVEFYVASGRMESITGLLAELGQNLNKTLKEKYLGRVSATLVVDPERQDEVKGLGLLIDKYSEQEMAAGEVEQH